MGQRADLHTALKTLLGTNSVYFQPPPSLKMSYPCFIYKREPHKATFASNKTYSISDRWTITFVTGDPDSDIPAQLLRIFNCKPERNFTTEGLYHHVFSLTF